jgi:hypothetical protein
MRGVLIAAVVLLTAACGAYQFPGASPETTGTVTGRVTVKPCGPSKPVPGQPEQTGQPQDSFPCKMRPASAIEIVFTSDGKVTSASTDADGRYRIELPEGTYKVSAKNNMRIVSGPLLVTIKAGSTVTADYVLDSGIRPLPVPQQ